MESIKSGPHGHSYDYDPHDAGLHTVVEGEGHEDEHCHGKKSVLEKVKAKAKKIKDTIKKHGHGHDRDHDHEHNEREDHGSDETEEEEDKEMVEDPEVHGAPGYESTVIRSRVVPRQDEVSMGQARVNLEKPSVAVEDRYGSKMTEPHRKPHGGMSAEAEAGRLTADKRDDIYGAESGDYNRGNIGQRGEGSGGQPMVIVGREIGLVEDPTFSDPPNYQTKVTDPTGTGEEVGITPLLRTFDRMDVCDEEEPKERRANVYTGSHDQFAPEPPPTSATAVSETTEVDPTRLDASQSQNMPYDVAVGSLATKISSATSAVTHRVASAKNAVASKLGYGGDTVDTGKPSSAGEDGQKIASRLGPAYEKVAGVGSTVMSKVSGGGTQQEGADKGVSVKEYLAEKFRPSDEDRLLSEVISDAFHRQKGESAEEKERKAAGKVTESEEVARRLDTDDGGAVGDVNAGKGVADRVKGVVGSWLGKSGE